MDTSCTKGSMLLLLFLKSVYKDRMGSLSSVQGGESLYSVVSSSSQNLDFNFMFLTFISVLGFLSFFLVILLVWYRYLLLLVVVYYVIVMVTSFLVPFFCEFLSLVGWFLIIGDEIRLWQCTQQSAADGDDDDDDDNGCICLGFFPWSMMDVMMSWNWIITNPPTWQQKTYFTQCRIRPRLSTVQGFFCTFGMEGWDRRRYYSPHGILRPTRFVEGKEWRNHERVPWGWT